MQLNKIYRSKNKFEGTGNNFNYKCIIYYAKCELVSLSEENYLQGIIILLKDQALKTCYSNQRELNIWPKFLIHMFVKYEDSE